MDDLKYGTRNKRGDWSPNEPAATAPIWRMPPNPLAILKWLPGYFLPFNLAWAASAVAYWAWVVPDAETMKTLAWGWALKLYAINAVLIFLFYGAMEMRLYVRRRQGTRFKYNSKFPSEQPSDVFWFNSQNLDNALRGFLVGVPIWTLFQVVMLWAYANGIGPWVELADSPIYLAVVALLVPLIHETHFYLIHRLIHTPFLYKWVHSVHHNSVNPSPWSSLSMHPVEHLAYFATIFYHFIIPSNPIIALYQINFAGFGAVVGHIGFDKVEVGENGGVDTHAYIHYLHHKYFEVNYGDGLVPFDKWFGTFHDGSKEGDALMQARFQKKKARMNA